MKRNIITCTLSYMIVIIIAIIFFFSGAFYFCVPVGIAVFFFAGKLFLMPTGENKVDLAVYYPSFFLFAAQIIYYITAPEPNKDTDYYIGVVTASALTAVAPSFLLWLGMISNKKKLLRMKANQELNEKREKDTEIYNKTKSDDKHKGG